MLNMVYPEHCEIGPCFATEYFEQEMQKPGMHYITISPNYHQNNGLAEVFVKIRKRILQNPRIQM